MPTQKERALIEEILTEQRTGMTEQQRNEHNAAAWLALSDRELVEQSGSLDLPGELHPDLTEETGTLATYTQLATARENADAKAVELAGKKFVDKWIKENRQTEESEYVTFT